MMNFLFPTFLFGLLAIAIPIIIHLFNFRKYKKVYFTNVAFLKELKQESDSKSKLKEWLILAMRILAISCLVFAFAQPFIPNKLKTTAVGEKAISVYIDNSFTMESANKQGTLLENAKTQAKDIANAFGANDKFQIITNDFEGKHQRYLSKEDFLEQLNEIKISSASKKINDVIKRQQDFLNNGNSKNKQLFLLSDFQMGNGLFQKQEIDTNTIVHLLPIKASEQSNVFIDSVWFETPVQQFGTQQKIHANIINKSNKDIENGSLKLFINGAQVSLSSFNVSVGNKTDASIGFTVKNKGINKAELRIDDYPITYDDVFYFSFNAQTTINAMVINGKESNTIQNFRSLMQKDSLFAYTENSENAIDYAQFTKQNIIILNELSTLSSGLVAELQKFIRPGGTVVVFPNKNADLTTYNNAFQQLQLPQLLTLDTAKTKTQQLVFEQGLYEGVFDKVSQQMDLPVIFKHYPFAKQNQTSAQNILQLQNGNSLLSKYTLNGGNIYLFSIPSDASCSNFLKHALFVPTIIKASILSLKPTPLYYQTAKNEAISITNATNLSDKPLHIIKEDKKADIIPEHRLINNQTTLFTQNQITEAGQYLITDNTTTYNGLAFNFNRKESDMQFYSVDDLKKYIDENDIKNASVLNPLETNLSSALKESTDGKKLWKLFLVLALLFLLSEILIIRLFRN